MQKYSYLCDVKLSVVIPVFRVEHTLQRCVESVLQQDLSDMEVILVDDGSLDHCPKLCDEWAEKDTRIKVIHQENKGLSGARNAGIDIAQGDYLTFVDSDDYLALNTYQPLLALLAQHPEYDILEYPIAGRLPLKQKTYGDMKAYWLEGEAYRHTYARIATTIATTDVGCYHYCYNPNGITAQADGNALAQLLEAHLQSGMPIDDKYYLHLANIQSDVWERTKHPILLPTRKLNTQLFHGKEKIKATTLNILGISILCRINKFIHLIKKPCRW